MEELSQHYAEAGMLIRKPVEEVFKAFTHPEITTKFWFTKSSGKLEENKQVEWTWEKYGVSVPVVVKSIEPNRRILIDWGNYEETSTVEWTFQPLEEGTFVSIINRGFKGETDEIIKQVRDSTGGFTLVLAGLKAWLEHHIQLNLVGDRFPKGLNQKH